MISEVGWTSVDSILLQKILKRLGFSEKSSWTCYGFSSSALCFCHVFYCSFYAFLALHHHRTRRHRTHRLTSHRIHIWWLHPLIHERHLLRLEEGHLQGMPPIHSFRRDYWLQRLVSDPSLHCHDHSFEVLLFSSASSLQRRLPLQHRTLFCAFSSYAFHLNQTQPRR